MKRLLIYSILAITLIVIGNQSFAQQNIGSLMISSKFKGDRYFQDLYYEKAIDYYLLALKKESDKDALRLKIGDCYRLLHEYDQAVYWYAQVFENTPENVDPDYKYFYANLLMNLEEYEEAGRWFEEYQKDKPEDSRTARKIEGINIIDLYYRDFSITEIKALPINTSFSELAATKYKDGIVFISSKEQAAIVDQDYLREQDLYDLYFVSYDSVSGWAEVQNFDKVLNSPYHEGPLSFYNGQDKLLFTRNNYYNKRQTTGSDGLTRLQLYLATKTGDIWANIQPFQLNTPEYSIAHPALNQTNDTLFFVSDKPGGIGGTDIYMSTFDGKWSDPINLGPDINTEGDELFPFYTSDRLFFASDGHDGLGGLDIYIAALKGGEVRYISNLGSPINSSMDDFSYSIDPETKSGYFSSNRQGGLGSDDIYQFSQNAQVLEGVAIQDLDHTPIAGVRISLFEGNLLIASTLTGKDGTFRFYLPLGSDFLIEADKEDHVVKTNIQISTRGKRVDIDTLLIEMHEHDFFAKGLIYDSKSQEVMFGVRVIIEDVGTQQKDTIETGLNGTYSFVIEPDKDYKIRVDKERFSSDSVIINTFSIEKGIIRNDFVLEEDFLEKRTTFFDYDKYSLRSVDIPVLQEVMEMLKKYPEDWLIIGAHADARGSVEYNQELSDKRANAVVEYFVSRGISKDKIISRGFGEGLLINRCTDGVNCREEDHSKNRRAEIVITKKLPKDELQNRGF